MPTLNGFLKCTFHFNILEAGDLLDLVFIVRKMDFYFISISLNRLFLGGWGGGVPKMPQFRISFQTLLSNYVILNDT